MYTVQVLPILLMVYEKLCMTLKFNPVKKEVNEDIDYDWLNDED